jgi:hypothetical protein
MYMTIAYKLEPGIPVGESPVEGFILTETSPVLSDLCLATPEPHLPQESLSDAPLGSIQSKRR